MKIGKDNTGNTELEGSECAVKVGSAHCQPQSRALTSLEPLSSGLPRLFHWATIRPGGDSRTEACRNQNLLIPSQVSPFQLSTRYRHIAHHFISPYGVVNGRITDM